MAKGFAKRRRNSYGNNGMHKRGEKDGKVWDRNTGELLRNTEE